MSKESFVIKRLTTSTPISLKANIVTNNNKLTKKFKKGIKRDATLFKTLKDEKYWDT